MLDADLYDAPYRIYQDDNGNWIGSADVDGRFYFNDVEDPSPVEAMLAIFGMVHDEEE